MPNSKLCKAKRNKPDIERPKFRMVGKRLSEAISGTNKQRGLTKATSEVGYPKPHAKVETPLDLPMPVL